MEAYNAKSREWIGTVLKQPGLKEWRAFRNPFRVTPEVMAIQEFDSLSSCLAFIESEDYAKINAEMKAMGCTNYSVQLWGTSPIAPEPLRP
jgi:hypothetical protein